MYKQLFLLKKSGDEQVRKHFDEFILKHLSRITGNEIKSGKVESNLLLEQKYDACCEVTFKDKQEMDKMMNSEAGRELNKDLFDFHKHIDIITINYNN
ncbi:MAG: hypothetical protein IPM56_07065 [Ignavibacteriales bacterium]|nr:MAG: hypothetical protein IPM56_07065 [Ignavibacteriales bacterium]